MRQIDPMRHALPFTLLVARRLKRPADVWRVHRCATRLETWEAWELTPHMRTVRPTPMRPAHGGRLMLTARLHPIWVGGRDGYRYSVLFDGKLLVERSGDPQCDAARALLAKWNRPRSPSLAHEGFERSGAIWPSFAQ
jgi:hypothetical protein